MRCIYYLGAQDVPVHPTYEACEAGVDRVNRQVKEGLTAGCLINMGTIPSRYHGHPLEETSDIFYT